MTWTTPGQWVSTGSDRTPPVLTLVGGDVLMSSGGEYIEQGYSATDDVDGDITSRVIVTLPNLVSVGSKLVTYDAFDIRGNTTTQTRGVYIAVGDLDLLIIKAVAEMKFTVNENLITAFKGRANRDILNFTQIDENVIINTDDDGYFDFDNNSITSVEVIAGDQSIDSSSDFVSWSGADLSIEFGALDINAQYTTVRIISYIGSDTKGTVFVGPGYDANIMLNFIEQVTLS